ncbi:DUF4350 domain-containing protein [Planctomicrobium sp. SH661]|uniref:DUF4350 domain-containing protein n=1 Tax=Planctomicrobium sp. SH661 TaxID=3448124 RepID=UPI003F5C53BC
MSLVRSSILLAVFIFVTSIVLATLSLLRTPDSGGRGRNSYGTHADGYRAAVELLNELNVPAQRRHAPPVPVDTSTTLVFLQPDPLIAGTEPAYLKSLLPWVEKGGRLVVAAGVSAKDQERRSKSKLAGVSMPSVTQSLELGVEISVAEGEKDLAERIQFESDNMDPMEERQRFEKAITESFKKRPAPPRQLQMQGTGTLNLAASGSETLFVPGDSLSVLKLYDSSPAGTIELFADGESKGILAAEFPRGLGKIVLVSEPRIFSNVLLARGDNSVLAMQLLAPEGQKVVVDEFYHGLSVRGNTLYLLTRPGYAAVAVGLLAFACLMAWRNARFLGPPLQDRIPQRRDLSEYINAMGRFFSGGNGSRPFLVGQLRSGVLREISKEFSLPEGTQDVELVAGIVSRRNAGRGDQIRNTFREVDAALEQQGRWSRTETLDAMRRLTACLSKNT